MGEEKEEEAAAALSNSRDVAGGDQRLQLPALPGLLHVLWEFSQACCAVPSRSPYLPNIHS